MVQTERIESDIWQEFNLEIPDKDADNILSGRQHPAAVMDPF